MRPIASRAAPLGVALTLFAAAELAAQRPAAPIPGFAAASAAAQRALEARFLAVPSAAGAARTVAELAARPHLAGTPGGRAVADSLAAELESLGFEVRLDRYDVYLPHPRHVRVALVAPDSIELRVREPYGAAAAQPTLAGGAADSADAATGAGRAGSNAAGSDPARDSIAAGDSARAAAAAGPQPASAPASAARIRVADGPEPVEPDALRLNWNAYSANGAVEGPVVYANYGLPADYAVLDSLGIDVAGKIVLARLGRSYRGVKVREAEARGAAGVLLFPDPAADGFAAGDTLPAGPYRPSQSVQRGTVAYMWRYTGDPLTPGDPSVDGVERLDPSDAANLPTIPVAPIAYGEAARILGMLAGPSVASFRGSLPLAYAVGPGPGRVRLEVEQEFAIRPIWNVIATLPGAEPEYVVLGNHYDAWLHGGVDPHSGTAVLMEVARGLAALRDDGWSPRRGIVLGFWDAEEFGVVGSTEWVEDHYDELRRNAIAYFNVDVFTAGTLDVSGSPSLRELVVAAAEDVTDPVTGRSVADGWRARQASTPDAPLLADIGVGSDWTAFLHFAGVPSLQWTMNGRGTYAVYHSVLDDARYHAAHADPGHAHAPVLARVMGLAALRLAQADALPFSFTHYADRIDAYVERLADAPGVDAERLESSLRAIRVATDSVRDAAAALEAARAGALDRSDRSALDRINALLPRVERSLLDGEGMPDRPWYRHTIYAPDPASGYGAATLPGIAAALDGGNGTALAVQTARVVEALRRAARVLRAAAGLEPMPPGGFDGL